MTAASRRPLVCALVVMACTPRGTPKPDEVAAPVPEVPEVPVVPAVAPVAAVAPASKVQHHPRPATIAVAGPHVCALEGAGGVACWGYGRDGQLSPDTIEHSGVPVRVPGVSDAVAVAAVGRLSCALRASGALTCWGRLHAPSGPRTVTSSALGSIAELVLSDQVRPTACARRTDGTVACAGGAELLAGTAEVVDGLGDAVAIAAAYPDVFVLRADGSLHSFNPSRARGLEQRIEARQVMEAGAVADIAVVDRRICAALQTGEVRCRAPHGWDSQVPTAGPLWRSKVPADLWADTVDVDGDPWLRCVRDVRGAVRCQGNDQFGQRGVGRTGHSSAPRRMFAGPARSIDAGDDRVCAVGLLGEVQCFEPPRRAEQKPARADALALASSHACALAAGSLSCWGYSETGAVGVDPLPAAPVAVPGLADLVLVAVGEDHNCAARRDHTVHCWGEGEMGQLGDGKYVPEDALEGADEGIPTHRRATPEQVAGIEGEIVELALAGETSCVATSKGLWCWGALPDPTPDRDVIIPRPRRLLEGPVRAVAGEDLSMCAVDAEGGVHCWGPVADQFEGGKHVEREDFDPEKHRGHFRFGGPLWPLGELKVEPMAIAVGGEHACVVSESDALWCWGLNEHGQLGDGTTRDRPSLVQVVGLPGPVAQVSAGANHTCAVLEDGAVHCWGAGMAAPDEGSEGRAVELAAFTGPVTAAAP